MEDESVVNVEFILLSNVTVVRFDLGKCVKRLILADIVKSLESGSSALVLYKVFGDDSDVFKCGVWVNLEIMRIVVKLFRGTIEVSLIWLTRYVVMGGNMDIVSTCGAGCMSVVCKAL